MKRNTFFARFLVTNSNIPGEGEGYVIEHLFTTQETYILQTTSKDDNDKIENSMQTLPCMPDPWIVDTSNGLLVPADDVIESGWDAGYLNVAFNVIEDGVNFPTLADLKVHSVTKGGLDGNADVISKYSVVAYAIGMVADGGHINSPSTILDNTRWVETSNVILRPSLTPKRIRSNKFMNKSVFSHPAFLPDPTLVMDDVVCTGVFKVDPVDPVETDCCVTNNHSNAINAAAILVASGNATTPVLIKKIEDAVNNNFDLQSTIAALQGMRQLGTLSNMTGKVLDNVIQKDFSNGITINNGKEIG